MSTAILLRFNYPKVPGDERVSVLDVTGPASYVEVIPGTPGPPVTAPTGGQTIRASDFGLQEMDFVSAMGSSDGNYAVSVIPLIPLNPGGSLSAYRLPDGAFETCLLKWSTTVGPQEEVAAATDLSGSSVRLFAWGR